MGPFTGLSAALGSVCALLTAALGGVTWYFTGQLDAKQAAIEAMAVRQGTLESANALCAKDIDEVRQSYRLLESSERAAKGAASAASKRADETNARLYMQSEQLLAEKSSGDFAKDCTALNSNLTDAIKERTNAN